jgi:tellurite resistance protein
VPISFRGRQPGAMTYAVIERPCRDTVDIVVGAAALMACADGQAAPSERTALIAFLRRHGLLALHGRRPLLATYDSAVLRPVSLSDWDAALQPLGMLAGTHGATLATTAAAHIAMADGVTWPQEVALLHVMLDRLGLRARPAAYGSAEQETLQLAQ